MKTSWTTNAAAIVLTVLLSAGTANAHGGGHGHSMGGGHSHSMGNFSSHSSNSMGRGQFSHFGNSVGKGQFNHSSKSGKINHGSNFGNQHHSGKFGKASGQGNFKSNKSQGSKHFDKYCGNKCRHGDNWRGCGYGWSGYGYGYGCYDSYCEPSYNVCYENYCEPGYNVCYQYCPTGYGIATDPVAASSDESSASPADAGPAVKMVRIDNPAETQTALGFAVNGETYTLGAGESKEIQIGDDSVIEFDRGGDNQTGRYTLSEGDYRFASTPNGWELFRSNNASNSASQNDSLAAD